MTSSVTMEQKALPPLPLQLVSSDAAGAAAPSSRPQVHFTHLSPFPPSPTSPSSNITALPSPPPASPPITTDTPSLRLRGTAKNPGQATRDDTLTRTASNSSGGGGGAPLARTNSRPESPASPHRTHAHALAQLLALSGAPAEKHPAQGSTPRRQDPAPAPSSSSSSSSSSPSYEKFLAARRRAKSTSSSTSSTSTSTATAAPAAAPVVYDSSVNPLQQKSLLTRFTWTLEQAFGGGGPPPTEVGLQRAASGPPKVYSSTPSGGRPKLGRNRHSAASSIESFYSRDSFDSKWDAESRLRSSQAEAAAALAAANKANARPFANRRAPHIKSASLTLPKRHDLATVREEPHSPSPSPSGGPSATTSPAHTPDASRNNSTAGSVSGGSLDAGSLSSSSITRSPSNSDSYRSAQTTSSVGSSARDDEAADDEAKVSDPATDDMGLVRSLTKRLSRSEPSPEQQQQQQQQQQPRAPPPRRRPIISPPQLIHTTNAFVNDDDRRHDLRADAASPYPPYLSSPTTTTTTATTATTSASASGDSTPTADSPALTGPSSRSSAEPLDGNPYEQAYAALAPNHLTRYFQQADNKAAAAAVAVAPCSPSTSDEDLSARTAPAAPAAPALPTRAASHSKREHLRLARQRVRSSAAPAAPLGARPSSYYPPPSSGDEEAQARETLESLLLESVDEGCETVYKRGMFKACPPSTYHRMLADLEAARWAE